MDNQRNLQHRVHNTRHNPKTNNKKQKQHNRCWTPLCTSTNNEAKYEPSYKKLEVNTNRTSFLCGNRNGHHNTELITRRHIIGQHKNTRQHHF
jgi:hypothetical protein